MSIPFLSLIGGIILLDLILSGDNALVLGAVAAKLPRKPRLFAITLGGVLAILLRILFTGMATLLLNLPLLKVIGAGIILWIAARLLVERDGDETNTKGTGSTRFLSVILSITLADLSMSLDNILVIGALANGNVWVIIFGLLFSIVVLLIASALVAELMKLLPWLLDLAALVLAWTAASMIIQDQIVGSFLNGLVGGTLTLPLLGTISWVGLGLIVLLVCSMFLLDLFLRARSRANRAESPLHGKTPGQSEQTLEPTTVPEELSMRKLTSEA